MCFRYCGFHRRIMNKIVDKKKVLFLGVIFLMLIYNFPLYSSGSNNSASSSSQSSTQSQSSTGSASSQSSNTTGSSSSQSSNATGSSSSSSSNGSGGKKTVSVSESSAGVKIEGNKQSSTKVRITTYDENNNIKNVYITDIAVSYNVPYSNDAPTSYSFSYYNDLTEERKEEIDAIKKRAEEAEKARNEAAEEYKKLKKQQEKLEKEYKEEYDKAITGLDNYGESAPRQFELYTIEYQMKINQLTNKINKLEKERDEKAKKMTQEYNNLSAICKKYNYIGDPVEISTGNFFYADDVYTAQDYGDQFSVRINLNSEQNIESFGKNWSCSLDSRIIRNNFTDNILSISEIQVLINKFNEMNGVISAYNEEYPDFQSDYFNSEYVNNKKSIKDLEELITLKREKEKINQQIDGLNKYVTYGKYGNKESHDRHEEILTYYDDKGIEYNFLYNKNGEWKAFSEIIQKRIRIFNLDSNLNLSNSQNNEGGYLVSYYNGNKKYYSKYGVLTKEEDKNHNVTEYENVDGRISKAKLKTGEEISITRNEKKLITEISGTVSGTVRYYYADDCLISAIDSKGRKKLYSYDGNNNVVRIENENGITINLTNEYNQQLGKYICTQVDTGNQIEKFVYELEKQTVIHQLFDFNNGLFYDDSISQYDESGSTVYKKDSNGNEFVLGYNEFLLLTSIKQKGDFTKIIYDENYFTKEISSSSGLSSFTEYNEFGQLLKHYDADNFFNKIEYDENGNIQAVYFCDTIVGKFQYYPNGLLRKQIIGDETVEYEYNRFGSVIKTVRSFESGKELIEVLEYDDSNRVIRRTDCDGKITLISYETNRILENINGEVKIERKFDSLNREYETIVTDLKKGNEIKKHIEYDETTQNPKKIFLNNVLIEENEYYRRNLLKTKKVWPYNRNHNNEVKKNTSNIKKQGIQFQYVYDINDNLIEERYEIINSKQENENGFESLSGNRKLIKKNVYSKQGDKTRIEQTDYYGNTTVYLYDKYDRLIRKELAHGKYEQYSYSKAGRLLQIVDNTFCKIKYSYRNDGSYTVTKEYPNGFSESYCYDSAERLITTKNPLGYKTLYNYDSYGNLLQEKGINYEKKYEYDTRGRLISFERKDKNGLICSGYEVKYDDQINQIVVYKENQVFEIIQLDFWNRVIKKDGAEGCTSYVYDEAGQLEKIINGDGNEYLFEYNALGKTAKTILPDGTEKLQKYHLTGENIDHVKFINNKKIIQRDFLGNTTEVNYSDTFFDSKEIFEVKQKTGNMKYEKDLEEFKTTITFENNSSRILQYDSLNNLLSVKNQNEKTMNYEYDPLNRIIYQKDYDNKVFKIDYDDINNSILINVQNDNIYIEKNFRGQITRMKDNDTDFEYEYDTMGNLLSSYDAISRIKVDYAYDQFGRCIKKKNNFSEIHYEYDNCGRICKVLEVKSGFFISKEFDQLGRTKKDCYSNGLTTEFTWNENNQIVSKITRSAIGEIVNAEFIVYDSQNRISLICDKNGYYKKIEYDAQGRVIKNYLPYSESIQTFALNEAQKCGLSVKNPDNVIKVTLSEEEYSNVLMAVKNSNAGNEVSVRKEMDCWCEIYSYDFTGNVSLVENNFGAIEYQYDNLNRIIQKKGQNSASKGMEFSWSDNNCLTQIISPVMNVFFEYDCNKRQSKIEVIDFSANEKQIIEFEYDPLGRRVTRKMNNKESEKYVYDGTSVTLLQCIPLTSFNEDVYNFGKQEFFEPSDDNYRLMNDETYTEYGNGKTMQSDIQVIDAKGFYIETKVESEKIKTPDYMNTIQKETRPYICFGFDTNQLCCVYADNTKPAGVDIECLISDSNNRVVSVCNQQGDCVFENEYDFWGNSLKDSKHSSYSQSKSKISGQFELFDLGYRDYCPQIKSFTTEDPLLDGSNWYAYCATDCVNFIDPNGLFIMPIIVKELMTDYDGTKGKIKAFLGNSLTEYIYDNGCYLTEIFNADYTMNYYGLGELEYDSVGNLNEQKSLFNGGDLKTKTAYDEIFGEGNHDYWTRDNSGTAFLESELAKMNADFENLYFVQGVFDLSKYNKKIKNHMVGINEMFDENGMCKSKNSISPTSEHDVNRLKDEEIRSYYSLNNLKEIKYVKTKIPPCQKI